VEFWATWCGPCRATIPHLSKLAKQHANDVTVIGVDIWEQDAGVDKIKGFVASMGERMSYPVAIDDASNYMATAWMQASGRQGIPSSFVVDRQGRVAWIGHPQGGLDGVLSQLISGVYDPEASKRQLAEEQAQAAKMNRYRELMAPFMAALEKHDYAAAKAALAQLERDMPDNPGLVALHVQAAISCGQPEEALALTNKVIDDPDSKVVLGSIGLTIAETPEATEPLLKAGARALEKLMAMAEGTDGAHIMAYGLALTYFRLQDKPRASAAVNSAIRLCIESGESGARFLPTLEELQRQIESA
jgi:hypothetical protein